MLTGLHCGLGSRTQALSNAMTKDGKAVKNPVLITSVEPGLSEEITGPGLVEFQRSGLKHEIKSQDICILTRSFFLKSLYAYNLTCSTD